MIDQDIEILVEDAQEAASKHPLREDDYISPELEQESVAFALKADKLHELRDSVENETASQDVVLDLIAKLIVWRSCP
jgi:hypothetical protein